MCVCVCVCVCLVLIRGWFATQERPLALTPSPRQNKDQKTQQTRQHNRARNRRTGKVLDPVLDHVHDTEADKALGGGGKRLLLLRCGRCLGQHAEPQQQIVHEPKPKQFWQRVVVRLKDNEQARQVTIKFHPRVRTPQTPETRNPSHTHTHTAHNTQHTPHTLHTQHTAHTAHTATHTGSTEVAYTTGSTNSW